jgi:general secretion pathway protein K
VNASAFTQRGVALIVALLVVALATVLIAGLLDRGELAMARTRNQLRDAQAQSYALGLEAYAARVLVQDQAQGSGIDTADSAWALPLPPTPVPGGTIAAEMSDLNGRFNLNNLDPSYDGNGVWRAKFSLLLQALKVDPKLTDDVVAWIGAAPSAAAAGDAYYLGQPVPYRAAKRTFAHVSELRLVRGVDGDVYTLLAPHLCALPRGTTININTATVPVLMTLAPNMTAEMAQPIWQQGHAHFRSMADVRNAQPGLRAITCEPCYDIHSSYFLARGVITLDGLPLEFASTIERRVGGANGGVRVLQRSRGTD